MAKTNMVEITKRDTRTGWFDFKVGELFLKGQAKIYTEPSSYGINDGRVLKLEIRNSLSGTTVYNYDRGLDFTSLPDSVIEAIVDELEEKA